MSTPFLTETAYPLAVGRFLADGFHLERMTGSGFVPAPGLLVTCAHCAPDAQDLDLAALVARGDEPPRWFGITDISPDPVADLAIGRVDLEPRHPFTFSSVAVGAGLDVQSVGYPLMRKERIDEKAQWTVEPRVLKGYVTREFLNSDHAGFPPQATNELDMLAPAGASGSPLFTREGLAGTMGRLVGVVYGSHDSFTIAEEGSIDSITGDSTAEVRRYSSFGLAHTLASLGDLAGDATNGRPLRELMIPT